MEYREEIWKDIEGYEGYQVSSLGRVKAKEKIDGNGNLRKERMLLPYNHNGYNRVGLVSNGKRKHYFVHRLVATAFVPNPNGYEFINHKSEVKTDNSVDNLEWCDFTYNIRYGTAIERKSKTQINGKCSKKIGQYDLNNELVKIWVSAAEYERQTGNCAEALSQCANGKRHTAYNYVWRYIK